MRYDKLCEFLGDLEKVLYLQAYEDEQRGRDRLAKELHKAANDMHHCSHRMYLVWKICEPYFKATCPYCQCMMSDTLDGHRSAECVDQDCSCHNTPREWKPKD